LALLVRQPGDAAKVASQQAEQSPSSQSPQP
jgi:hypothetical protein